MKTISGATMKPETILRLAAERKAEKIRREADLLRRYEDMARAEDDPNGFWAEGLSLLIFNRAQAARAEVTEV